MDKKPDPKLKKYWTLSSGPSHLVRIFPCPKCENHIDNDSMDTIITCEQCGLRIDRTMVFIQVGSVRVSVGDGQD